MIGNIKREFDEDQKTELREGMIKGLNIAYYNNPEFMAIQMRQIRLGLEEGLDVTIYNKVEYDWFQMEEIRKGIKERLNYKAYAKPSVDYKRMRQIRKGLRDGIDLSRFIKLDAGVLEELRKAMLAKVSIVDYITEGYEVEQLTQIRYALERNIDIRSYINIEYRGASIREIVLGLQEGIDVSVYASMDYGWQQMRELRLGMEARLDVSDYADSMYSWQQMRELRLGLEEGLDISRYNSLMYMHQDMEKIRKRLLIERTESIVEGNLCELSDSQIAVFISNDEMEACIEIRCSEDVEISAYDIKQKLKMHGICHGILSGEIEDLVRERKYRHTIVVAKGKPAIDGEDGRYEFFFNTCPNKLPRIMPDGSADFTHINWFEVVKEGQKVAYYHEAGLGKSGYTVTGKLIKPVKGKEKKMLSGKGFELLADKKTYISSMNGKIDLTDETELEITRVYVVDEVNLTTGNIDFDGSVYVNGNVGAGSVIRATENIVVEGFVEAAVIKSGGEICLRKGVNGGGVGYIEAAQNIMGQFFENVRVISGGDISAYYALNCNMHAEGSMVFYGTTGMLLGGFTRAAKGLKACNIGNRAGINTTIRVGVDDEILNEVQYNRNKMENVCNELSILNHSYEDFKKKYPAEVRNTMELFLKIENAIYTKELELKKLIDYKDKLQEKINEYKDAKVEVNGALYEGTKITIDNIVWDAFSVKDVTIRCKNKKVIVESN